MYNRGESSRQYDMDGCSPNGSSDHELSDEEDFMDVMMLMQMQQLEQPLRSRARIFDSKLTGPEYTNELLNGNPQRMYNVTRFIREKFVVLRDNLIHGGYYVEADRDEVSINEALMMFLFTLATSQRNRGVCDRFSRSTETVSRYFQKVLDAVVNLSPKLIFSRNLGRIHSRIRNNKYLYPHFKHCIGAIDGTHITACVPLAEQPSFRDRNGNLTQNVLAVVDHDMRFTFVYAGYEGSAHDSTVFQSALVDTRVRFPMPPIGKFYAVDSAYKNMPGFLAPYTSHRYHQSDFVGRTGNFSSAKELFNHKHSSVRNVVERSFGVLKSRFHIIDGRMYSYAIPTQVKIVIACCACNNMLKDYDSTDPLSQTHGIRLNNEGGDERYALQPNDQSPESIAAWEIFRNEMASRIWNARRR